MEGDFKVTEITCLTFKLAAKEGQRNMDTNAICVKENVEVNSYPSIRRRNIKDCVSSTLD